VAVTKLLRGSILLEVLLAITILSVSVTLVIQAMTSSLRATRFSSDTTIALFLLENKMTELIQAGGIKAGLSQTGKFSDPYNDYRYLIKTQQKPAPEVSEGSVGEVEAIHELTLEISWNRGKKEKSVSAVTYLFGKQ
jgi:Tfp pilus assembly protein PilV